MEVMDDTPCSQFNSQIMFGCRLSDLLVQTSIIPFISVQASPCLVASDPTTERIKPEKKSNNTCFNMHIKQLYQWIFTHKKQYAQLYVQYALTFQSHQTWLQKCPFISEYCMKMYDRLYFEQAHAASLPINCGNRIPLECPDDIGPYSNSTNLPQFEAAIN